jgi:hypothetical protein
VEGNKISMELEVPGVDIVGFEHEAKTRDDKTTLEKAKQKLSAPVALFKFPAAAGCRLPAAGRKNRSRGNGEREGVAPGPREAHIRHADDVRQLCP